MSDVWNALDAREQALVIWLAFALVVGLATAVGRQFVVTMLEILHGRLGLILLTYAGYVAGVVVLLERAGLWTAALAGVTAFWFAGPGLVMFFTSNAAITDPHYLRIFARRALWFVLGIEFIVNFFPLPLWWEIALVPVLATIALFGVLPPNSTGARGAKTFSEVVLALFGIFLVARFVVRVASDFDTFASSETLARFWLPPALTLAVLPFFYLLGLYMLYEQAFLRLGFYMRDEPLLPSAKRTMIRRFRLNLRELREVGGGPLQVEIARADSKEGIARILREARGIWKGGGKQRWQTGAKTEVQTAPRTP